MSEQYYSVEQIATMLGMHPKTIQRYIREGRLKAQKFGKSWRVTGHDLSLFTEGTVEESKNESAPGLQRIIGDAGDEIKVSTVIDIPVRTSGEAAHVANWVTACLNASSSHCGYVSMTSQYIQPENVVRIMLWGELSFIHVILSSLHELKSK